MFNVDSPLRSLSSYDMHLLRSLSELSRFKRPLSLALGVFDGVHLGHQTVIREAVWQARSLKGDAAILTFHPHPAKVLRPESAPRLLTTEQQDYELFSALDADLCVILDFTKELGMCRPLDFLDEIRKAAPSLRVMVVGPDWHFGHGRTGNFKLLKAWAGQHKIHAIEVSPSRVDGEIVSSTMIRNQITEGNLVAANQRLGRPYQIVGRVVSGDGFGAEIGFPTANLDPESEVIPARGVYAARALLEGGVFAAAVNIGVRPTVARTEEVRVEAHLLDFDADLYGFHMRLDFVSRIREERKFRTVENLKNQITADTKIARRAAHE